MSLLFTWIPAVPANALPYDQIISSADVLQALADYTCNYIGEDLYNITAGLLGTAWQWLYMGMDSSQFNEMLDAFFDLT
ncbi:hypothetical protein [Pseudomonas monteilii]|uniref:hypothetical protein n=1 Tax=Pseudomonas monteilii TaxID=76759 RepID=UPI00048B27B1|nr:hypothetical protein [Pseudomonas monteilii]